MPLFPVSLSFIFIFYPPAGLALLLINLAMAFCKVTPCQAPSQDESHYFKTGPIESWDVVYADVSVSQPIYTYIKTLRKGTRIGRECKSILSKQESSGKSSLRENQLLGLTNY